MTIAAAMPGSLARKAVIAVALLAAATVLTERAAIAQDFDPSLRGDVHRSYTPDGRGAAPSPYRIFVPSNWRPGEHLPLVVILHGGGETPDSVFENTPPDLKGIVQREAGAHRFIVVAPGSEKEGYGVPYLFPRGQGSPARPGRPAVLAGGDTPPRPIPSYQGTPEQNARDRARSETDVMAVIDRTIAEYGVDARRIYLMGNSMGGMGTYYLAAAHPGKWCAISPSDGPVDTTDYPFKNISYLSGAMIVHGEADTLAPIAGSRALAVGFRAQGVETRFVGVPGGSHGASWYITLPRTFDFFAAHRCGSKAS